MPTADDTDAFNTVCPQRLNAATAAEDSSRQRQTLDDKVAHFTCPSLPHLIALLCRPNASCIPSDTSLVVVDSLSTLVNHAFPRAADPKSSTVKQGNKGPLQAARRQQTLQYIVGALQKLAVTRCLAVVVLNQCATRMQLGERGAALIPAVNAGAWDEGVSTRLVLFRDWSMRDGSATATRFAAVLKLNGSRVDDEDVRLVAFDTGPGGVTAVSLDHGELPSAVFLITPAQPKRRRANGDVEIPDSDDEDYGWEDEDAEALPPMPPQWQGSEDILLGNHPEGDSDDQEEPESDETEEGAENPAPTTDSLQS